MRSIRSKDSEIERLLRRELWKRGLRYRKNVKTVFGKPDIVFLRKKIAIFVDSEFWHGFNFHIHENDFHTRKKYWINKIKRNIERDLEVTMRLRDDNWIVLRYWGKDIINKLNDCADEIESVYRKKNI